ncbi:MAG: 6-phosphogluconolactonase [Polaribacter sp.]|jgi:6-phosphogluconolactonase
MIHTNLRINKFNNREELFKAIANKTQHDLAEAVITKGGASFIVPGGTTPAPAFDLLSKAELEWEKITIAQSDERWLDASHAQSNERLTRENLLINNAKIAKYISMKNDANTTEQGELDCNKTYASIPNPFTICMLGMGLDGHIASLFPDSKNIDNALSLENKDLCIAIDATGCPVAGDYPKRMSLTLSAILHSETILLLITGKEKLSIIENLLEEQRQTEIPVSRILNQSSTAVEVFWCN